MDLRIRVPLPAPLRDGYPTEVFALVQEAHTGRFSVTHTGLREVEIGGATWREVERTDPFDHVWPFDEAAAHLPGAIWNAAVAERRRVQRDKLTVLAGAEHSDWLAGSVLPSVGPGDEELAPELVAALTREPPEPTRIAIRVAAALVRIGPASIPALLAATESEAAPVSRLAEVLSHFGSNVELPVCLRLRRSIGQPVIRKRLVELLDAGGLVRTVVRLSDLRPELTDRLLALTAAELGSLDATAPSCESELARVLGGLLRTDSVDVRPLVLLALHRLGARALGARDDVSPFTTDPDPVVRRMAENVLRAGAT